MKIFIVFGSIIISFLLYCVFVGSNLVFVYPTGIASKGQLGDAFGGFTSLCTALGFGGLLLTLWYQKENLTETKNDYDLQHFENIFFRMLEIHNTLIKDIDLSIVKYESDRRTIREIIVLAAGRDFFYHSYISRVREPYEETYSKLTEKTDIEQGLLAYKNLWDAQRHNLGHYFRYLYNIFKYIDQAKLTSEQEKKYSNLVRAQLSDYELLVLFYNGLSVNGTKFKKFIEKYQLFKNIPIELLLKDTHRSLYPESAYKKTVA